MSTTQWIAIITVTLGLAISALGNETGDHLSTFFPLFFPFT